VEFPIHFCLVYFIIRNGINKIVTTVTTGGVVELSNPSSGPVPLPRRTDFGKSRSLEMGGRLEEDHRLFVQLIFREPQSFL
jgi:hypothetical protein